MSDDESDTEFDGFQLTKSDQIFGSDDFINKPLGGALKCAKTDGTTGDWAGNLENSINLGCSSFSGSFLEENLFSKSRGFGEPEKIDEKVDEEENDEKFAGLDWDASRIFKNLACPENNNEQAVCVLRLHDVLTKTELGVQQMTRQMIQCGKLINGYSPKERRDLGFSDASNIRDLSRMLRSLRAATRLMLIEADDIQELLEPSCHPDSTKFPVFSVVFGLGIAASVPMALWLCRRGLTFSS
ncbi:unnamed protein product [Caenorhabditis sp. 36 PRJEB53466]|nr:unnamed protein product [Caenorhabditis sp. 36 PRJEB53466]